MEGGVALEMGCGRGVGVEIILEVFKGGGVHAFDLDPRMVSLATKRLASRKERVRLWTGDATQIESPDAAYDAVFDFGVIHHIPDWRKAVSEAYRVLKPGGRFYAEEVFRNFTQRPFWQKLLEHPREDRFDFGQFQDEIVHQGFQLLSSARLGEVFGWFVARRPEDPAGAPTGRPDR
jgi:ubiquinone/menaquinone biosynthesis C-methylase UbiE